MNRQVDNDHYHFTTYVDKRRWMSVWYQLSEVFDLRPSSVLEVGLGPGYFSTLGGMLGLDIKTLDVDADLRPDIVGSVLNLPFRDMQFDVVCAFQVLEHFPFESSLIALQEASRVAERFVVLTLPDARKRWKISVHISNKLNRTVFITRPWGIGRRHVFDGQHYWEVNKKGFELKTLIGKFRKVTHMRLISTYRFPDNDYHRFFLFARDGVS